MTEVRFLPYDKSLDSSLEFAVIAARHADRWIFCRHCKRTTWELPGGHREPNESIEETARRELYEETGAESFDLTPVCIYRVSGDISGSGMLYYAQVHTLGKLPPTEIAEISLRDSLPDNTTYPLIQPKLLKLVQEQTL